MGSPKNLIGGILAGLALVLSGAIGAAAAKERLLTEDSVSRFLASFSEMRTIAMSEGLKISADPEAANNPLGAVLKAIKSSKLKTEAGKVAAAHGFADLNDWAGAGRSIAQAYLFITVVPAHGIARETLERNKEAAISQLEKLGLLSDKSKENLKKTFDSWEDWLASEPPPENVAIVKKMKGDIEAAVKLGVN